MERIHELDEANPTLGGGIFGGSAGEFADDSTCSSGSFGSGSTTSASPRDVPSVASPSRGPADAVLLSSTDGAGAGSGAGEKAPREGGRPPRARRPTPKASEGANGTAARKRSARPVRGARGAAAAPVASKCKWGNSCLNCTRAKRKCDGGRPCGRCDRLGKECIDKVAGGAAAQKKAAQRAREAAPREETAPAAKRSRLASASPPAVSKMPRLVKIDDAAADFASAASVLSVTSWDHVHTKGSDASGADSEAPGSGVLRLLRQLSSIPHSVSNVMKDTPVVQRAAEQHMRDLVMHRAFLDPGNAAASYAELSKAVEVSLQSSPIATVRMYFDEQGKPCRMFMNNRCASLFGANPVLLTQLLTIGKPVLYVHPDDFVPRLIKGLQAHATRQRNFVFEGRYRHTDGLNRRYSFFRATEYVAYEYYPSGRPRCVTAAFVGVRGDPTEGTVAETYEMPMDPLALGLRSDLEQVGGAVDLSQFKEKNILFLDDPSVATQILGSDVAKNADELEAQFSNKLQSLVRSGVHVRVPPADELRGIELPGGQSVRDFVATSSRVATAPGAGGPPTSSALAAHPPSSGVVGTSSLPSGAHGLWATVGSMPIGGAGSTMQPPPRRMAPGVGSMLGAPALDVGQTLVPVSARFDSPMSATLTGGTKSSTPVYGSTTVAPDDVDDLLHAVLAAEAAEPQRGVCLQSGPLTPNVFRTFSQDSADSLPRDYAV